MLRFCSASVSSFSIAGKSLETTYKRPDSGSIAAPPQFAPPLLPGIWIVLRPLGGVKRPWFEALRMSSRNLARSSGDRYGERSSTVKLCRANGGGLVGNGCVGHVFS